MKCIYCASEMKKGVIKVSGSVPFSHSVSWFPEEEQKKNFKDNLVSLENVAEGYRCDTCKKVISIFDEK